MTERAEHTAGPWKRSDYGQIVGPSGRGVLFRSMRIICSGSEKDIAEAEANTNLIAAAPDLLAALATCQKALAMMIEPKSISATSPQCAWAAAVEAETKARAAISRATGEA